VAFRSVNDLNLYVVNVGGWGNKTYLSRKQYRSYKI
jgi:hypothetical protein